MDARAVPERTVPAGMIRKPTLSLMPHGLRERLIVAFALMSVVPLLVLGYVVSNYVFPKMQSFGDLSLVVGIAVFVAFLGFVVVRSLVLPVIQLASDAQAIAAGRMDREANAQAPGEAGELGQALNQITQKARENIAQLRIYGEQTHRLNLEINQRMLALSNILQVSNLISQSTQVEEVLDSILEKLIQMDDVQLSCLLEPTDEKNMFKIQAAAGLDSSQAVSLVNSRLSAPWLRSILDRKQILVVDGKGGSSHEGELFQKIFGMANVVCQPLICLGRPARLMVCANPIPQFTFREDTLDLLKVFGKQISIAIENDLLAKRAKELEVVDELTGLYNAAYLKTRLDEEIKRAVRYHRPCSLVMINVDNFRQIQEVCGVLAGEKLLTQIAEVLSGSITEVDRVGRTGLDEFALVLPERNKREAIQMAESIRSRVGAKLFPAVSGNLSHSITISAGVSESPIDGSTGPDLVMKAGEAVRAAKRQGRNRVAIG